MLKLKKLLQKTESHETEAEISNVAYDFSGINAGPAVENMRESSRLI